MVFAEVLIRLGLAWAAVTMAKNRGRDPVIWGLLTLFFIFPILLLLILPPVRQKRARTSPQPQKEEPFTGQTVEVKPLSKEGEHTQEGTSSFGSVQWYLLDEERKSVGPFSFAELQQKFWDGDVVDETFVWMPDWKEWKKVGTVPGLLLSLAR